MVRLIKGSALASAIVLLSGAPARALEVVVKEVRTPGSSVTATVEIRDPLPDRFKELLEKGRALHLRV